MWVATWLSLWYWLKSSKGICQYLVFKNSLYSKLLLTSEQKLVPSWNLNIRVNITKQKQKNRNKTKKTKNQKTNKKKYQEKKNKKKHEEIKKKRLPKIILQYRIYPCFYFSTEYWFAKVEQRCIQKPAKLLKWSFLRK